MAVMSIAELQEIQPYNDGRYRIIPSEYNSILNNCEAKIDKRHNTARKRLEMDRDSAIDTQNKEDSKRVQALNDKYNTDRFVIQKEYENKRAELEGNQSKIGKNNKENMKRVWLFCLKSVPAVLIISIIIGTIASCNGHNGLPVILPMSIGFGFSGITLATAILFPIGTVIWNATMRGKINKRMNELDNLLKQKLQPIYEKFQRDQITITEQSNHALKQIADKYTADSTNLEASIKIEKTHFIETKARYSTAYEKGYYEMRQAAMESYMANLRKEQDNAVVWLSAEIIKVLEQFWEEKQLDSFLKRCGYLINVYITNGGITYQIANKMRSNDSNLKGKYYSYAQADEHVLPNSNEIGLWGYCKALAALVNESVCNWLNEVGMSGSCKLIATDKELDEGQFTLDFDSSYPREGILAGNEGIELKKRQRAIRS